MLGELDIAAYSRRVGYRSVSVSNLATLTGLHQAHASTIPFENLDIQMRRPVGLDLDRLQTKLIHNQRGGYCFEHNTLFLAVLEHLGFNVIPHLARVRQGSSGLRPRTHMVVVVRMSGADYLCDVGFGGRGRSSRC